MKSRETHRRWTPAWPTLLWALAVVLMFGLVVADWVRDDPDTPLAERLDIFLLLTLLMAVVAYTVEGPPLPSSRVGPRIEPECDAPATGSCDSRVKSRGRRGG
jgi:hypothetical protein